MWREAVPKLLDTHPEGAAINMYAEPRSPNAFVDAMPVGATVAWK
jgi:hypothetical protein